LHFLGPFRGLWVLNGSTTIDQRKDFFYQLSKERKILYVINHIPLPDQTAVSCSVNFHFVNIWLTSKQT